MIKGIYGFNVVVKDLEKSVRKYEEIFGVKAQLLEEGLDFAFPGIKGAKLNINGIRINLITPVKEDNQLAKFIEKKGEGLYLVSVEVDNIEEDVKMLKEKGMVLTFETPLEGRYGKVTFTHPKSLFGVLLEIYQPSKFVKIRWGKNNGE